VRQVRARHFDIVLLDWHLPGVDGLAVLAALREAEAIHGRPRAHVIAVTAHTGPGDRETCLAAGADDYLGKPYLPADLLARMAQATVHTAPLRR
jgi:CheY-like chemotaxis protein